MRVAGRVQNKDNVLALETFGPLAPAPKNNWGGERLDEGSSSTAHLDHLPISAGFSHNHDASQDAAVARKIKLSQTCSHRTIQETIN